MAMEYFFHQSKKKRKQNLIVLATNYVTQYISNY